MFVFVSDHLLLLLLTHIWESSFGNCLLPSPKSNGGRYIGQNYGHHLTASAHPSAPTAQPHPSTESQSAGSHPRSQPAPRVTVVGDLPRSSRSKVVVFAQTRVFATFGRWTQVHVKPELNMPLQKILLQTFRYLRTAFQIFRCQLYKTSVDGAMAMASPHL